MGNNTNEYPSETTINLKLTISGSEIESESVGVENNWSNKCEQQKENHGFSQLHFHLGLQHYRIKFLRQYTKTDKPKLQKVLKQEFKEWTDF